MPDSHRSKNTTARLGLNVRPRRVPLIMGVLNVTPDSFSDGGHHLEAEAAVARALQMAEEGADIIDIGGESTRPGSQDVAPEEELRRVLPVIETLAGRLSVPMSIDTRRARVARAALEAGCDMVNDVSACRDPDMAGTARDFGVPIVLMHMKGEPRSMQVNPSYRDVGAEVADFLRERVDFLKRQGIEDGNIIIDPGIGFGKRFRDNLVLLESIDSFLRLGCPVLVGASRKAFLGELLDAEPGDRLSGCLAVAAWCHRTGVDIVRVHDVKETAGLFRVLDAIEHPAEYSASW